MRSSEEAVNQSVKKQVMISVTGGILALLITILLILGVSVLVLMGIVPEAFLGKAAMALAFLGSAAGAWVAVKQGRGKTLILSLGSAIVFFLLLMLGRGLFFENVDGNISGIAISVLLGGALSGILGGRSKKRRK